MDVESLSLELAEIFSDEADPGRRVVLVAGQALAVWGAYYLGELPLDQLSPLASRDIDFYTARIESVKNHITQLEQHLQKQDLSLQVNFAHIDKDAHAPNALLMRISSQDGSEPVIVDFLDTLYGLTPKELMKGNDKITMGEQSFYILNPVLCLKARISNLLDLYRRLGKSEERMANEEERVKLGIQIVHAHLSELIYHVPNGQRIAHSRAKVILEIAKSSLGRKLLREKHINILTAIPMQGLDDQFYKHGYLDAHRKLG